MRTLFSKVRVVATLVLTLFAGAIVSPSLLPSTAAAIEPEKQPTYSNIENNSLCGTVQPGNVAIPCTVPAGQRLVIDYVSGYAFRPTSTDTTLAVSLVVTDPALSLNQAAFHTFLATKTSTSQGTDVFTFSTPFRMMLHGGATFFFSPADNAAVSGYLVKQ
jgi:hypothetical protein